MWGREGGSRSCRGPEERRGIVGLSVEPVINGVGDFRVCWEFVAASMAVLGTDWYEGLVRCLCLTMWPFAMVGSFSGDIRRLDAILVVVM